MTMTSTNRLRIIFIIATVFLSCLVAQAQSTTAVKDKAANLLKKNIAATGLGQSMAGSFIITDAYADKSTGNFLVYLQQVHAGIPVYNKISVYIFKNDTLLHKTNDFIRKIPQTTARVANYSIDAPQAVRFAAGHLSIPVRQEPLLLQKDDIKKRFVYRVAGLGTDSTTACLVWLPMSDSTLKLAWNVRITSPDKTNDWFVRIDAQTGDWLEQNSLVVSEAGEGDCVGITTASDVSATAPSLPAQKNSSFNTAATMFAPPPPSVSSASYRVYPYPVESANFGPRSLETDPWLKAGAGNNATTLGWHFDGTNNYNLTRGNNVWAQENLAGATLSTGFTDNSSTAIPLLTFDNALDPSMNPVANTNLHAAIDNVFYWNNLMHDVSYQYGFDEAAGNFQASNVGRGGIEGDYVHAFAQDGSGINNANFATPPDGQSPTMRMYAFNYSIPVTFHVNSPAAVVNNYTVAEGYMNFASQLGNTGTKTGNIVLVIDGAGTAYSCGVPTNAASLAGNIALIDRGGGCSFAVKIKNAQNAGAIAVIVINNTTGIVTMTGTDASITIPAVMISQADGAILKANLSGLNGTISVGPGLYRDGSLDAGVISHEYTHGISNRLTGGPANAGCLVNAEEMGEGWSDYVALMMTTNWATATPADGANARPIGTYVISQSATGPGLRTHPYSTNMAIDPWTYGMMAGTNGEVHTLGEIWCSAIWDMTWNIIQTEGIDADIYHGTKGNNIALKLVIEAMKYQPCSPGFLDARDAILKADSILYNYAHRCAIWNAFAGRGMGKSALQGSSNSYQDQTAATDLPVGLGVTITADKSSFSSGDNVTYTIKAYCDCSALSNISILDTLSSNLAYVSSTGGILSNSIVHFDGIGFAAGETKTFTIQTNVSGTYAAPVTLLNDTRDPANYTWTMGIRSGSTNWVESATRSHSSSHAWFAADQGSTTDFSLMSGDLLLDNISTLSFWHYFETDPGYDGGFLEISTDGGSTWKDLGPYMTTNPYNSSLDPTTGVVGNHGAFTGSSGGVFIQTIVTLTDFAGKTARIRFRFASDVSDGGEGWYVDDIILKNEKGIINNAFAYNGATQLSGNRTFGFFAASALPVHFISFDAQQQNNTALLHWKVNQEINVASYVVQRSTDGTGFSPIGKVAYTNSGNLENNYYFTDIQPANGTNYYRIAEQDADGRLTLSSTRLLRFGAGEMSIRLSPVPAYNGSVQLYIDNANAASFNAYLLNAIGQVVKTYPVKAGANQLSLQNFARGVYYVKVGNMIKKLIVQ